MTPTTLDLINLTQGCRLKAYRDSRGVWTIGRGHTGADVHEGLIWTQGQADEATLHDMSIATQGAITNLGVIAWIGLDTVRQAALIDATFTLGANGLAEFHHMLADIQAGEWVSAARECKASRWNDEDPRECEIVAEMLLTGEWPAALLKVAGPASNEPSTGTEKVA